ncbi:MAG: hypothetical protein AB7I38_14385 [Dehalococcoidia bacterium]
MDTDDVALVIPWRPTPDRLRAFHHVVAEWQLLGYEPVAADAGGARFNLAASRNLGVRRAEAAGARVVVVSDADTFPTALPLEDAVRAARSSNRVHLPYTEYRSLGLAGTLRLTRGAHPPEIPYQLVPGACSGVFVAAPATWWSIGGMDERFTVWAPEDYAFRLAHETLLGPLERHPGAVYALHHEDQPSKAQGPAYDACVALYQRYVEAHHDVDAMRALVDHSI